MQFIIDDGTIDLMLLNNIYSDIINSIFNFYYMSIQIEQMEKE